MTRPHHPRLRLHALMASTMPSVAAREVQMGTGVSSEHITAESQRGSVVETINRAIMQADSRSDVPAEMRPAPDHPAPHAAMQHEAREPRQAATEGANKLLVSHGSARTLRRSSSGTVTILPAVDSPRKGDPMPDAGSKFRKPHMHLGQAQPKALCAAAERHIAPATAYAGRHAPAPLYIARSAARRRSQSTSRLSSMAAVYEGSPAVPSLDPPAQTFQLPSSSGRSKVGALHCHAACRREL